MYVCIKLRLGSSFHSMCLSETYEIPHGIFSTSYIYIIYIIEIIPSKSFGMEFVIRALS